MDRAVVGVEKVRDRTQWCPRDNRSKHLNSRTTPTVIAQYFVELVHDDTFRSAKVCKVLARVSGISRLRWSKERI